MKLDEVRRRLTPFPGALPAPPSKIDARVVALANAQLPDWISQARGIASRRAAALCLIFPDARGEAHIVLTERPSGDLRHAGQISFPGGAEDPGDHFPVGTALREAHEEVGLDTSDIEVVGTLDVVDVRVSGFLLTPVVALTETLPALVPDPREVASIILAPLDAFLPGAPVEVVDAERDG